MSSNKEKESVAAKLARLQKETGEAGAADPSTNADLVAQLTHEEAGKPDFADIAKKLKERQGAERTPDFNERTKKITIYVDADVAEAFDALCVNRGDKTRFATQAFSDFVHKMAKELGL